MKGTWIHAILAGAYAAMVGLVFLLILSLIGVHISNYAGWGLWTAWIAFCFASAPYITNWRLYRKHSCRRPTLTEEEKIMPVLQAVLRKAGSQRSIRLMIQEENEWNSFAAGRHTIVITKGLLTVLTEEEIGGLLAHELGHLQSGKPIAASAFITAGILPAWAGLSLKPAAMWLGAVNQKRGGLLLRLFRMAGWLLLISILFYRRAFWALILLALFVLAFKLLYALFAILLRALNRRADYRQDRYAYQLGYGPSLRKLLEKLAAAGNQPLIIYERIRRLQKQERSETSLAAPLLSDDEIGKTM